ncbi:946_t:CDS:1, partial [Racocetra fulgida]
ITVAHATPVKESKLKTLGVRFQDSYQGKTFEVLGIHKAFKVDIAKFIEEIGAAANEHNKELVKELLKWNSKYDALVDELEATA